MAQEVTAPPAEDAGEREPSRGSRFLKELPVLLAVALGIAILAKAFLIQAFYIPSGSMEPTLQRGDRVLVNKVTYRFGEPKRGDVVVFRDPLPGPCEGQRARSARCDQSFPRRALDWGAEAFGLPTSQPRDFIKRIVALPGETVGLLDGDVYICNEPRCTPVNDNGEIVDGELVEFPRGEGRGPRTDDTTMPPFVVPDDQYYVLGDHREKSADSRTFRGIDADSIVGRAFAVVWPPARLSGL